MSNYSKLTDFATKDTLPSGSAAKIVKGTEIDDEFQAIETAITTKANIDSPAFTGTPTAPTAAVGSAATDQIATADYVEARLTDMTTVDLGDWAITVSGTSLMFAYQSTNVFKIESSGAITSADNVTGYGTV